MSAEKLLILLSDKKEFVMLGILLILVTDKSSVFILEFYLFYKTH